MGDPFPLSLPTGTSAASLPWHDHNDRAWIVDATAVEAHKSTWNFGKTTFGRHICLHRFKLWWLKPSHGHSGRNVPPETALLLAERRRPPLPSPSNTCSTAGVPPLQPQQPHGQPEYVVLLPVSDTHARASLHRAGDSMASTPSSSSSSSSPSSSETVLENDPSALAVSADTGDAATLLPAKLGVLLVATGPNPFRLVRRLVREATERVRSQLLMLSLEDGGGSLGGGRGDVPEEALSASFVDGFGWCTWDSFYTMVTPEGVLEGLSTLRQGGVRPRWVILDDGWQSTTNDDALNTEQWDEQLVKFEANKRFRRFDEEGRLVLDLGDTVEKIKKDSGVDQVLAWHAMAGYWAGVEPEAPEMVAFNPHVTALTAPEGIREVDPEMQPELDGKRFGMVKPSHAGDFYSAYHKYLKENGVDGVKVDAQSILDCTGEGNGGVPAVVRAYHEGLCRSVQAAFKEGEKPAALIHCMCHAPSVLFLIASVSQDRAVLRGSDDFYPREPNSHGPHLYTNAFNALLVSNLGIQDWDMFQTGLGLEGTGETTVAGADAEGRPASVGEGSASWFHAAARAISGGPVYVSDRPGQHDKDILGRLVLDDGSVLRASTNALPTLDCLFRDPQQDGGGLLQVWALNALPGTGVVGSFNIQGTSFSQSERTWVSHRNDSSDEQDGDAPTAREVGVKGTVSPSDVHAFLETKPSTIASEGCAAPTKARRSPPEGGRAEDGRGGERDDGAGEGNTEPGTAEADDGCCYAVYLHRRRETRVVGLREAVDVEVLPLSYELATFSRMVDLRASPSAVAVAMNAAATTSTAAAAATAAGAGEAKAAAAAAAEATGSREAAGPVGAGVVRWAALGLPAMFNSSAAVTAQASTATIRRALPPQHRHPLSERETDELRENSDDAGLDGGGAIAGVSLSVKGSGTFLAVASRKPASARLYGGPGGGGGGDASEGGRAGEERLPGDDTGSGCGGGGDDDGGVRLQVSFSVLSSTEESTAAAPEGGAGTGGGGGMRGMGLVEVDLPGPWDGQERWLLFRWGV